MVEGSATREHAFHIRNLTHIPAIQGLIERSTTPEHAVHIGNLAHIPAIQGLIERSTTREHTAHIGDIAQIWSVYAFCKLHVFTTIESILHRLPFHCTKLFDTQKRCGTPNLIPKNSSHLNRSYTLRSRFYQQFSVFGGGVTICIV